MSNPTKKEHELPHIKDEPTKTDDALLGTKPQVPAPSPPGGIHVSPFRKILNRWPGVKPIPFILCVAVFFIIRYAVPKPDSVSMQGWQLLAMFLTTIAGLIVGPLPVGAWAFLCLTATVITKTLSFAAAFTAFTNDVIWLIVVSFFFSRGFVKTGLGDRVAMYFVKLMGKRTLGLAYGLAICETIIGPAVPSSTARAGGIFLPIIKSLANSVDSFPNDKSSKKLGAYLVQSQLQSSNNSSALFLTAAAQNLLCFKLAGSLGVEINSGWLTWFKYAVFPGLIALSTTPFVVYKLLPPELKDTPDAPTMAKTRLKAMGPIKKREWAMLGVMVLTVALWIAGQYIEVASVIAAMMGLSLLLLFGVLDWDDCLSEKAAWDTLTWFAILIGMANQLVTLGIIKWLSDSVGGGLHSLSAGWFGPFCILQLSYFFIHYLFASQTAHVGALYSAFLGMHLGAKVPSLLAAVALGYNTNLFGALTHYSSGQSAVYYGGGYVKLSDFFRVGILVALVNITLWSLVSTGWWKLLHLY